MVVRRSSPWGHRFGIVTLIVASGIFSFFNAGERVSLNIGVMTIYRISLVGLVFIAFMLGMLSMFLFGLRHDRRVRAALEASGAYQPLPQPRSDPEPEPYPFDQPPETTV